MVNLDNQRPGDVWMLGGTKYDVEAVERQGPSLLLTCRRPAAGGGTETSVIVVVSGPQPLVIVNEPVVNEPPAPARTTPENRAELRTWRAALLAGDDKAWAPTMTCWRVRQLFEVAGIPLGPPDDLRSAGVPEYRSLLDALLEDAEEHRAAGRVMQAANALAAVENLRTMPPWQPSIADVAPMVSGGPPATAEDDIEEGGW